jgi:hypothetical protein
MDLTRIRLYRIREYMKDLRQRSKQLLRDIGGATETCPSIWEPQIHRIEDFAREIREEALEEALYAIKCEQPSHVAVDEFEKVYSLANDDAYLAVRLLRDEEEK